MMLKYPDAVWKPLGTQEEPTMTGHRLVIVHTMVGYLYSTDRMFRSGGYSGTESHFGIGGPWGADATRDLDGVVWQWQDGGHAADANLEANREAISIETADNAPSSPAEILRWSDRQAEALARLLVWLCSPTAHAACPAGWTCREQGIPLALVQDSGPGRRGIAYHRQGVDPWRVSGGQRWSTAYGKECPGPRRIRQLSEEIIPRARQIAKGEDMALTPEDAKLLLDSKASDLIDRQALDRAPDGTYPPANPTNPTTAPRANLAETNRVARQNRRSLLKLETRLGELQADVADITSAMVLTGDRLASLQAAVDALRAAVPTLDLTVLQQAIGQAGADAAAAVTAAGERVLEDLDRVKLEINRG